ncbi:hypothetical protein AFM11_30415 [Mycolicibacterium wolinskyi]|uniref:DUF305 domain-containing protein n=1 Tax=Mycolicibacterium wolinskyi TaxID=59750 RepID=A0A132PDS4_9MYCO|nr:DUF305 domain-containing protein [Mycolicibacterium wolinskyi]KWX20486.1 hypothetical protein AFM11_30415 [Mycolicibacterium wolinskyi]
MTASEQTGARDRPTGRGPRWLTVLVAAGALVAAALLGGAVGLLLAPSPKDASAEPNPVDVGFAQDMTVHHQQAVTLASWARDHSDDPAIRRLAGDIEIGQSDQIGRMQGWLGLWSYPARAAGPPMTWMAGHDHRRHPTEPGRPMPGMATVDEIDRLRTLSGPDLDVYFLQLMIRHHQGGGPMMGAAIDGAAVGEVRNLAAQMLAAQSAEITTMTTMLTDRGARPFTPPGR